MVRLTSRKKPDESGKGQKGIKEPSPETASPVPKENGAGPRKNLFIGIGVAIIVIIAIVVSFILLVPERAGTGDTVSVYYTGMFENGTVFDSTMNATPVVFTIGNSSIIPGFEDAVRGMSEGEEKTVTIPYTRAYGAYNSSLIQTVNRTGPLAKTNFSVGLSYYIHDKTTNAYSRIKVLNVTNTTVTWDANNPLAGKNLTFTIKLATITKKI